MKNKYIYIRLQCLLLLESTSIIEVYSVKDIFAIIDKSCNMGIA